MGCNACVDAVACVDALSVSGTEALRPRNPSHGTHLSRITAQVDIVITACTFTPVPSLSAMVASYFGMRSDVLHYSLGGQGCTSGIIEVELAAHLLRVRAPANPRPCILDKGTRARDNRCRAGRCLLLSVIGCAACQLGCCKCPIGTIEAELETHPLLKSHICE